MPSDPLSARPASQESAMAAASQMTVSGTDRVLNRDRIAQDLDLERPRSPFIQKLLDLFKVETENVPNVEKKAERKPLEEQLQYYERLKRITDYKINSVRKKRSRAGLSKKGRPLATAARQAPELATPQKVEKTDPALIKDFILLNAKKILRIPQIEQDKITVSLSYLENKLREKGFSGNELLYLKSRIKDSLMYELSHLIKDTFIKALNDPARIAGWILKNKNINELIAFAFYNKILDKYERAGLEPIEAGIEVGQKVHEIADLIKLAQDLGIDLDYFLKTWLKESAVIISGGDFDREEISLLVDELRILATNKYLSPGWFKRLQLNFRIRKLTGEIMAKGANAEDIREIDLQAKRIAWLKCITSLKEAHLNRIFTASLSEFEKISRKITGLTKQTRYLGKDIQAEGLQWVETEIETLSLNSAEYKLNLLKSLQTMGYEAQRARDIKHLERTILKLKRRSSRIHELHAILKWWKRLISPFLTV